MNSDGKTFKKIRLSRNIKQAMIIKKELARTTLSRFENDQLTLSSVNFQYVLSAMDVSVEEFNYIKNDYSYSEKEEIIANFNRLFATSDNQLIKQIERQCDCYLKTNYSRAITCISRVMKLLQHMDESSNDKISCFSKIYVADIWHELSQIDEWTLLDIKIINCCLHFFELETAVQISQQLVQRLNNYQHFSNIVLLEASIYLNLTVLFFIQNDLPTAKKYSDLALTKAHESKRIDYLSIAFVRNGIVNQLPDKIKYGLQLATFLNDDSIKQALAREIADFTCMRLPENKTE